MADLDKQQVLDALDAVIDPVSGQGLATAGLVRGLTVSATRAGFMLEVPSAEVERYAQVREAAEGVLYGLPGIEKAQVVLTAEVAEPHAPRPGPQAKLSPQAADQGKPKAPVATARPDHVKHVVVVGSGKGGVGKSTVSLNLALGLKALGLNVGWLDADIYGPSGPVMLGLNTPPSFSADKKMLPPVAFGLKVNSVGFLVDPDQAMIWRGPMASQALTQLLTQTQWGTAEQPLDVLIVDLPPGTGDVQLTLTQKTVIDGAVVVSTPQDMALIDARRAVTLFDKTQIPVLGIVENMAYFMGADGTPIEIFGRGGAKKMAETLERPFLGEVPLDPGLRQAADSASPLRDGPVAERFAEMAKVLWAGLTGKSAI